MTKRDLIIAILLPFAAVVALDQSTKLLAEQLLVLEQASVFGPISIKLHHNYGFMLGAMKQAEHLYTIVLPATVGAFILYLFLVIQYFLPIRSLWMRAGLAIFVGGVTGNILDRLMHGYVIDFIKINNPIPSGIFNLADVLQWFGLSFFLGAYIKNGSLLYPKEQRRGRKWIDPSFQSRYCLTLLAAGFCFSLIGGTLAYSFLKVSLDAAADLSNSQLQDFLQTFIAIYSLASTAFFITLFIFGVMVSHRIVGPVRAFERYMDELLTGKTASFKLRKDDEFRHLEGLAQRYQNYFQSELGIQPAPLKEGRMVPQGTLKTMDSKEFDLRQLKGKPLWLVFYRYATCPLCILHLSETRELFEDAMAAGVEVFAIFESSPEQFVKPPEQTGKTGAFLASQKIHLVADPNRDLYGSFKTRVSNAALFRPKTLLWLIKAHLQSFKQGSIDGKFGQLPAHFLVDPRGKLVACHYGVSATDHIDDATVRSFLTSIAKARQPSEAS